MPISEQRIAELIFRVIAKNIRPEEMRELKEEYLDVSAANRQKFDELTNKNRLLDKLRAFYAANTGNDDIAGK